MKRLFLLAFLLLFFRESGIAQIFAYTGTAVTSNAIPLGSATNRRQCLYLSTDFPGAPSGNITKIYIKATAATGNFTTFEIKMGQTTLTALVAGPFITTGMSTVFTAAPHTTVPGTITAAAGDWISFTLSTPFYYDNTKNFIVDLMQSGYSPGYSLPQINTVPADRTLYGAATAATASNQARLPQLAIEIAPSGCSGTPNVPTISGPSTAACGGSSVALTSVGHSTGVDFTYQWQSRPAGSTGAFTDEPAGTSPSYNPSPIQSTEYQLVTKCNTTSLTSTSNKITVNVTPNPSIGSINESHTGLAYTFTGIGVQNASSIMWDYGDAASNATGVHTYAAGGTYTVKLTATNACGSDTRQIVINASPNIPCTIPDKPLITTSDLNVCSGATFDLVSSEFTINTNITFQWQRAPVGTGAFIDILGATNTYITSSETANADYRLVSTCSSTGNVVASDPATIHVIAVPEIATPENVSVHQYENAIFTVSSNNGQSPVIYRWQSSIKGTPWVYVSDNGNYRGSNTPQLMILNATIAQDSMLFRCVLEETGGCNFVPDTSAAAILRVDRTTSVNIIDKSAGISVYPNPVSGSELFINAKGLNEQNMQVSVMDVMGRVVLAEMINIDNSAGTMNISKLPSGIYYIRLAGNSNTVQFIRE